MNARLLLGIIISLLPGPSLGFECGPLTQEDKAFARAPLAHPPVVFLYRYPQICSDLLRPALEGACRPLSFVWFKYSPEFEYADGRTFDRPTLLRVHRALDGGSLDAREFVTWQNEVTDRSTLLKIFPGASMPAFAARNLVLERLRKNYSEQTFRRLVQAFEDAEKQVSLRNASFGVILDDKNNLMGTVRSYSGSPHTLPLSYFLKLRGLDVRSLDDLASKCPDCLMKEVGNFLILPVEPNLQRRTKLGLLKFLLEHEVRPNPAANFIVHVATEQHRRLYEREFGFRVIQSDWMEDIQSHEMILQVKGEDLIRNLERQIRKLERQLSQEGASHGGP